MENKRARERMMWKRGDYLKESANAKFRPVMSPIGSVAEEDVELFSRMLFEAALGNSEHFSSKKMLPEKLHPKATVRPLFCFTASDSLDSRSVGQLVQNANSSSSSLSINQSRKLPVQASKLSINSYWFLPFKLIANLLKYMIAERAFTVRFSLFLSRKDFLLLRKFRMSARSSGTLVRTSERAACAKEDRRWSARMLANIRWSF